MIRILALVLTLCAAPLAADETGQRPLARGDTLTEPLRIRPEARRTAIPATSTPAPAVAIIRPRLRPYERPELASGGALTAQLRAEKNLFAFSPEAPAVSLRPARRTAAFIQTMADRKAAIVRGQVCNDPAIQGKPIGDVAGQGRCGIDDAVQVRSVAGVTLQPAARMDCTTANALKRWVTEGVLPATDNQATSLRIVSGYSCRFRNAAAAGKLSEHSFGRAIDIAGVGLKSGREITVLTGWNSGRDSAALRRMWQAACGPFGTVLGPESNRYHRDHFHFDTARYRSGSYCR